MPCRSLTDRNSDSLKGSTGRQLGCRRTGSRRRGTAPPARATLPPLRRRRPPPCPAARARKLLALYDTPHTAPSVLLCPLGLLNGAFLIACAKNERAEI